MLQSTTTSQQQLPNHFIDSRQMRRKFSQVIKRPKSQPVEEAVQRFKTRHKTTSNTNNPNKTYCKMLPYINIINNKTITPQLSIYYLSLLFLLLSFTSHPQNHLLIEARASNSVINPPVRSLTTSNNQPSIPSHQSIELPNHSVLPSNYVRLGDSSNLRTLNQNKSIAAAATTTTTNQSISDSSGRFEDIQKRSLFDKICIGTSNRLSGQSNKTDHYQNLVERYKDCTYVIGNLEITWLQKRHGDKPLDLTFLESIREITGHLLIAYVDVDRLSMPNLQIIRGKDLFRLNNTREEYAMFVMQNKLKSLELPNLREILIGDVGFSYNQDLCYPNKIEWGEILNTGYKAKVELAGSHPECPECHEMCNGSGCWGPGADMCQKLSKTNCSPQCDGGRCFGPLPRQCCHLFCAGGCTGPKQTDCLACKDFYNDGECIQECPAMSIYNTNKYVWETDPNGKYAFGATCVKECPEHLLRDNGACVRSCPPDKRSKDGECVPCGPDQCPKNCQGVDVVNSKNIDQMINCTEIQGSITILDTSFYGYTEVTSNHTLGEKYEPMHPSKLKVLDTIKNITGYLNIQAHHPDFKDLSFLSKLEVIHGRITTDMFHSLSIIKTSLVSLNLRSLKKISSGKVVIEENKNLCFANSTQFNKLITNATRQEITIRNNGDQRICKSRGSKCHEQCSPDGCWGPGQNDCLSCNNFILDDYCVQDCKPTPSLQIFSFQSGHRNCSRCHPECKNGCRGTAANDCFACKNLKDGPYCVAKCPGHKFNEDGNCSECHKSCVDGCTGPSNHLGPGGCNSCGKFMLNSTISNISNSTQMMGKYFTSTKNHQLPFSNSMDVGCIKSDDPCPEGYYEEYSGVIPDGHPLKHFLHSDRRPLCKKCHPRCKRCTGYGTHKDVCECAGYLANDQCEEKCHGDYYTDEKLRQCKRCSHECNGCTGPTNSDCLNCKVYRVYYDQTGPIASPRVADINSNSKQRPKNQARFNCTAQCPPDKPHRIVESNSLDPYCSEEPAPDSDSVHVMFIGSTSIFSVIILLAVMLCVSVYKCQIDKAQSVKRLTMHLSGFDDVEPLNKSNISPNLAPLRNIKETELKRGRELGEGFGGFVYLGSWTPDGQKDPWPVAIKVLKDNGQSNRNKEFLDEAYIMASVNHPNLVKLLGVCMTREHFMLITQLVPLGCLLDYVQKRKFGIGSKYLLEWGRQIASGMAYLEEHRMVHRDLALRNVLLQTSHKVLISDFGLAKLLDADQSEYHSGGGRLPIKWLAPECIRERKFTHKSDVWAFGVTIWELLTFGERPFENYDTKDVPNEIEKGARLPQPNHVSAEVYKLMMSCWFYKPDDRPNFESLKEEFEKFKNQHTRYLKLPGQNPDTQDNRQQSGEYNRDSDSQDDELMNFGEPIDQQSRFEEVAGGFELRHHHSESETPNAHLSTPTFKKSNVFNDLAGSHLMEEDVFSSRQMSSKSSNMTMADSNNNNNNNNNFATNHRPQANSFWSVRETMSTNSLGLKSELTTDVDDYLIPSPCSNDTNEPKFKKFPTSYEAQRSRLPPPPLSSRDPPHSAGLIGISNHEYFYSGRYVNSNGPHSSVTNASSSHIPNSLV